MAIKHIGNIVIQNDPGNSMHQVINNEIDVPIAHSNDITLLGNNSPLSMSIEELSKYVSDMVNKKVKDK